MKQRTDYPNPFFLFLAQAQGRTLYLFEFSTNFLACHVQSNFQLLSVFFDNMKFIKFLQGDVDKDGYLDCGEFVAISIHLRKMGNDDHLQKAFEFFDKNQSGYIEIEELRDALADEVETTNEEIINAIIQDVDTNKVS